MTAKTSEGLDIADLMEDLDRDGCSLVIFSPHFHSHSSSWSIQLRKTEIGVKLEIDDTGPDLLALLQRVYDKFHSMLGGKLSEHLGMTPQIEHHVERPYVAKVNPLQELHDAAGVERPPFDEEIPF